MIRALKQMIGLQDGSDTVRECRDCGTGVTADAEACPECGGADLVEYDL